MIFVKWGGSLITDKESPGTPRPGRIRRLARELAEGLATRRADLVLGHGSGSFGHAEAARHGLAGGGVGRTQLAARRLHVLVLDALLRRGLAPFSMAPSAFVRNSGGRPLPASAAPVWSALDGGFLPVVFGDVVTDRGRQVSICSTEGVFAALAAARPPRRLTRVVWLGATDGVLDPDGRAIPELDPVDRRRAMSAVGPTAGIDVTGGIGLRLATAFALARRGVESWILDGSRPGVLGSALRGRRVGGTRVPPFPARGR